jgi:hypothetical protein
MALLFIGNTGVSVRLGSTMLLIGSVLLKRRWLVMAGRS